ncbi:hypothetical protein BD770DRAFT_245410 [Pilaira anomala]|nr:hypothetical protein BD770DRAFT_245410 [Pilaira anomala]
MKKLNRKQGQRNAVLITSQFTDEYYEELLSGSKLNETVNEKKTYKKGIFKDQENSEVDEDEEYEFSSDQTYDYHPQRTADYFLLHDNSSEQITLNESDTNNWIINGNLNISIRCKLVKENTLGLNKNPSGFSDIRLLSLNDIFIFDENMDASITKYFGTESHEMIMSDISYSCYLPHQPIKSHVWCLKIAENPPDDLISSLKLCSNFLLQATEQENEVDLHVAHTLTQV